VLPVSLSLALFYVGLAAMHHVVSSERATLAMDLAAVAATVASLVVALAAWRHLLPDYWAHAVTTGLIVLTTAYAAALLLSTHDPKETATFLLITVGTGVGLLRGRWFAGALVAVWVTWLACVVLVGGTLAAWAFWAFFMVTSSALAVVVLMLRRRSVDTATAAIRRASQAATEDPATGLVNRRGLALLSREVLAIARRNGDAVYCSFLDVDGLKAVNDRYGHDAGDRVILAVSQALSANSRATDVIARWGGDEFVLVGMGAGIPPAELERRLRAWLIEHFPSDATLTSLQVSVGHALLEPWDEGDVERLLWVADRDMYVRRAIRGGHPSSIVTVDGGLDTDL
jgi:diguanylate cyclase (GGDEF)-like protein